MTLSATGSRWSSAEGSTEAVGRIVAASLIALLSLAASAALALWFIDAETIFRLMVSFQRGLRTPYFDPADMTTIQSRAAAAGVGYLVLAVALVKVGPGPWIAVLADAIASARELKRRRTSRALMVLTITAVAAGLTALYANQVMRTDEANSFLNYGTRSPLVSLAFFGSTNNHILHSVLMRLSVGLFGPAEWSIRLPAMLAAIAGVPAIYLAARQHLDWETALLAAGTAAGSTYLIDLGTNARGYSIVNLCFLLVLALLPAMMQRRPAAWAAFCVLVALGAWTVPIMIYPFAIAMAWLVVRGWADPPGGSRIRWLSSVALGGCATGIITLLLLSPALVVTGAGVPDQKGNDIVDVLEQAVSVDVASRIESVQENLRVAWMQWIYPVSEGWAWLPLVLTVVGWGMALARGGNARALAVAVVVGPALVLAATALAAVPSWALTFLFIPAIMFAAVPFVAGLRFLPASGAVRTIAATATLLLVVSVATVTTDYPSGALPRYYGYRDAPNAAAFLALQDLHDAWVVVSPSKLRQPTNYYLSRLGHGARTISRDMTVPAGVSRILHVTVDCQGLSEDLLAGMQDAYRRTEIVRLPHSWVMQYERGAAVARATDLDCDALQPTPDATTLHH
jgi:Dolichyl-phosphate-mannose-protein mannosyltransferase